MNILDITSRVPYPLIDGARIVMHQLLVALNRSGHRVTLVAIDEDGLAGEELSALADLHVVQIPRYSQLRGVVTTIMSQGPFAQARKDRPVVYETIDRLVATGSFDLVIADQAHIAQYGSYVKTRYGIPYLLRSHNVEHEIYRRHLATVRNPLVRAYIMLQAYRWNRFECEQHRLADASIAITDRDSKAFARIAPGVPVATVPAAVDLSSFHYHDPEHRDQCSVVLLGNMAWPPNRDSLLWFVRSILPLIRRDFPQVVVHVVGACPPNDDLPVVSDQFHLHGRVESVHHFYSTIAVGVIPLIVGGGMRVKMVEMMASGLPVVATSIGAEGNLARPGDHYLSADGAQAFATNVIRLLRSMDERKRLARAARAFVEREYSLDRIASNVDNIVTTVAGRRAHG